jgi:hypothetical protein
MILNEITVTNNPPRWINEVLNEIIKQKYLKYQPVEQQVCYEYDTYTLSDSSGYSFRSTGDLLIPKLSEDKNYYINPIDNTIAGNKDAGPDFQNLKRMLYENVIKDFDKEFIKQYLFDEDKSFQSDDSNIVRLLFNSKKYPDNNGYIIADTLKKVILEFEQKTGTDYNVKKNTSALLRNAASIFNGLKYEEWYTQIHVKFRETSYYYGISECSHKFYIKNTFKEKKKTSGYFSSSEAQLFIKDDNHSGDTPHLVLPKPYYIIAILTKQMQEEENKLNGVPLKFEEFRIISQKDHNQ